MPPSAPEPALLETAHAKVNLDLLVLGRRADGYHELDSLVALTDLGDRLTFRPAPELHLRVSGPFAAALAGEEENLVLRAARALAAHLPQHRGAFIHLDKRLPVAAGLGGGSADAAATLRGLCRLWGMTPPRAVLHELALGLGSDIPACLAGGPARLRGRGERVEPVPGLPALPLLLVNPREPVPTGAVFAQLRPASFAGARPGPLPHHPGPVELAAWLRESRNTLEGPATALAPAIGDALDRLRHEPACLLARMSGSGATCFGLFTDQEAAARAATRLARARPAWWIAPCATLPSPSLPTLEASELETRLPQDPAVD